MGVSLAFAPSYNQAGEILTHISLSEFIGVVAELS